MAGLDFLLGAQGDNADAQRMGLLAAGLGILANNTGHYGAAAPALATGAMTGLQGYQGALDQQAQNRAAAFKQQQQEAALRAAQAKQAYVASLASGQRQFNPNEALANGFSIDEIKGMADFGNLGKAKVKDYREIRLPDGRVVSQGFDEYGQAVGEGQTPYKAPTYQDLGGRVVSIDPLTGKIGGELGKTMTPGEMASNAVARANLGISQQRLKMDREAAAAPGANPLLKGAPTNYMWSSDGSGRVVPIPGGPADPANAKEGKPPTEFESKSAMFGTRAASANKIFNELEGKYSPSKVKGAEAAANVPVVGGITGAVANSALSADNQKALQAKRDLISAGLRLESGAVIGESEFQNFDRTFFPQPGDGADVIKQKKAAREELVRGLNASAGKAARAPMNAGQPQAGGWSAKRID